MTSLNSYIRPHNQDIDEQYHQLTCYNILSSASFYSFLDVVRAVDGDIVECGIGRSRSLAILCALTVGMRQRRKIYAYDSFTGFPAPTAEDVSARVPKAGEWSSSPSGKYLYTEEFCRTVLKSAEIPLDGIDLVLTKGFFADTLPNHPNRPIALLNIDGDLYQSYKACLENLFDKVAIGGIILFDDFGSGTGGGFPGSRRAVKEFLGEQEYAKIQQNEFGAFFYIKQ